MAMEDGRTPVSMMESIGRRWAAIDPEGMLQFLMETKSPSVYLPEQLREVPFATRIRDLPPSHYINPERVSDY